MPFSFFFLSRVWCFGLAPAISPGESEMGVLYLVAPPDPGVGYYTCAGCANFVASCADLESSHFRGSTGLASLFVRTYNTILGKTDRKRLLSGVHLVRDVECKKCRVKLGWFYEFAWDRRNMNKEGKTCLENSLLVEVNNYDMGRQEVGKISTEC